MHFRHARLVAPAALLVCFTACKETTHLPEHDAGPADDEAEVLAKRTPAKPRGEGLYAADAEALQKNSTFFFRMFDQGFSRKFEDLPAVGEVPEESKPMSGGYYPESTGGTDVAVNGKTALAKYDEVFNGEGKAQAWEREKHVSGPAWAGHCNGFSAAGQRHPKEPSKTVVKNGVTFDPRDIKALMAEIHMSADYEFLGGARCELAAPPSVASRADPTIMGDCEDINPGTLHAAVGNWIGRKKHVLIIDQYSGEQVWNYPLVKYESSSAVVSETEAKRMVTAGGSDYIFNPQAAKFVAVTMKLVYVEAQKSEILGKRYLAEMPLSYVLELNAQGEILGGEWTGQSQKEHPDFLWLALEPQPGNGTRYMGNPHLDAKEVIKLWAESAGFDPDDPPQDVMRPAAITDWGRWATFEVTLDGRTTGAVFAGKKTVLRVKRKDTLAKAGVTLDVGMNGSALTSLAGGAGDELSYAFEPGPGLNRFQFTFKKDGTVLEDQFLRFHVLR